MEPEPPSQVLLLDKLLLLVKLFLLEKPVAIWSFNTMLYSSNEELRNSSSDFWCAVLSSRKEVDQLPVEIGWFPEYSDLRTALDTYGFLFEFSSSGEPKNIV
ncbi:uncharacterized protein LOC130982308 isoform X2 [Arachis stenosperma]|uniref:uncharacterized protein LOC130951677 n=1 Tax=Arachis stenosperma TaxID=217475 RepID=UPI0025ABF962|nr:uncharacterized protein LOC130951677 [Arachis stenosperma]XP_057762255.1 uncharacterized protein LOC130982308 isoform X2 [Arachis stenosperma]